VSESKFYLSHIPFATALDSNQWYQKNRLANLFYAKSRALNIEPSVLLPVRVVSHHLRLLGVLYRAETEDWLILVDCDVSQ